MWKQRVYGGVVVLVLGCVLWFAGCGDSQESKEAPVDSVKKAQDFAFQTRSDNEVRDMLKLMPSEARRYVMRGVIGSDDYEAYVWIGEDESVDGGARKLSLSLTIPAVYNQAFSANESVSMPLSAYEVGLESGQFIIKGVWDSKQVESPFAGKEFAFKVCDSCAIGEVDFITGGFESEQVAENEPVSYKKTLQAAFIPESNQIPQHVREALNMALNGAKPKQSLAESLSQSAQASFTELTKDGGGLMYNTEYLNDIDLVYASPKIAIFWLRDYAYEGGAHGNTLFSTRIFSLENGKELPNKIEDVLDMQKQDEILALLTQKLKPQADGLFALPLTQMPDTFVFDDSGMVMIWQVYSIAPYASGDIRVHVDFKELLDFVRRDSVYAPMFAGAY